MYTKEALYYAEVHVSEVLESHGIPDTYLWRFNELGQVIPEHSDTPIEDVVVKDTPLGRVEFEALLKIQEQAFKMNAGFIIWISPRHPIYYPDASKIIISEKIGETLLNKAFVTNWDVIGSILVAKELATLSDLDPNIFRSPTDVRANPIFIDIKNEEDLALALKRMLDKKTIEMIENGEDVIAKQKFMEGYLKGNSIPRGNSPLSCPVPMKGLTAFQIFSGEDEYGSLQFECPHCHKINTRYPHVLLEKCLHCKENVKCN